MHHQRSNRQPAIDKNSANRKRSDKNQRLILVSFAKNLFALPITDFLHRTDISTLVAAADLPPIFAGYLREPISDRLLPVVQPRCLFQLPVIVSPPRKEEALLVSMPLAHGGSKSLAFLVDDFLGHYEVPSASFMRAYGGHYLMTCVEHTTEIGGDFYPVIAPEALLGEIEQHCQKFLEAVDHLPL